MESKSYTSFNVEDLGLDLDGTAKGGSSQYKLEIDWSTFNGKTVEGKWVIVDEKETIIKLVDEFIEEKLPNAHSAFHHEAEIEAGFREFKEWLENKIKER